MSGRMVFKTHKIIIVMLAMVVIDRSAATNPGFKVRLSQSGLEYTSRVAVDVLSKILNNMNFPDKSGSNYNLNNMKVSTMLITYFNACLNLQHFSAGVSNE